ncbi:hypothetical protein HDU85_007827 [Gaertneriomyces sp. JEL0708]|nr:hypothetical protein HDU85_007827 [Gaertneriomyces sp. JEL0708]
MPLAIKHDELMINSAVRALSLDSPISVATRTQLMLPMSKGGFGLLSAALTAAPAYLSTTFNTLTHAAPFHVPPEINPLPAGSVLEASIEHAIREARTLHQQVANCILPHPAHIDITADSDILPSSASSFVSFYQTKRQPSIQSTLSSRIFQHLYSALVKGVSDSVGCLSRDFHLARLQSVTAEHSHRWLTVPPTNHVLRLTDLEYRWCARYRLGLVVTGTQDLDSCPCCHKHQAFSIDPWHYLSCRVLISKMGTVRHNSIALCIKQFALNAGCNARHEPANLDENDRKRPDLELFTLPDPTLVDVVVSNSVAPTHLDSAKKNPLAAADKATKFKHKKYKAMTEYQRSKFHAFACEALGGISPDAMRVVNLLTAVTITNCPWLPRSEVMDDILNHIAINIQRGNAAMIREGELKRRFATHTTI